jgi:GntR family transcriptional repressor for pyruvate dehydrogenase complex
MRILMTSEERLFRPYLNKRSFEEISDEIKALIFEGVFRPGHKLPSETEIARQFNVSRQTIREALRILELSGFITIQRGVKGGPVIQDTVDVRISNLFLDGFKFKRISLEELTAVRFDIERAMLHHVFKNVDNIDIENLKENILKARKKLDKNVIAFEENINFHKLLAKASKNYVYTILVESIMAVVSDFRSRLEVVGIARSRRVTDYHEEILNAIITQEFAKAMELFEEHLTGE